MLKNLKESLAGTPKEPRKCQRIPWNVSKEESLGLKCRLGSSGKSSNNPETIYKNMERHFHIYNATSGLEILKIISAKVSQTTSFQEILKTKNPTDQKYHFSTTKKSL